MRLPLNSGHSALKSNAPTWEEWYAANINTIRVELQRAFLINPSAVTITYVNEVMDTVFYARFNRKLELVGVQQEYAH